MSYIERIKAPGPKKILALDGGGIRGMMTVEIPRRDRGDAAEGPRARRRFRAFRLF